MRIILLFINITILFSSQIMAQWNKVEVITSPLIYSALFDGDNIFVGGDSLYISNNRGLSWTALAPTGSPIEITALYKFGNLIYLGTYGSGVYISNNGGSSWSPFNSGLGLYAEYAKKFVSSGDTLIYATDGGGVYILKPGSNVWQEYNQNLPDKIAWTTNDIVVTNSNIVLSSGASGYYYYRPKGSSQWNESRIQTPNGINLTIRAFWAVGNMVFSGSRFGIYRSVDNGITWDSVGIKALPLEAVCFTQDKDRIYVGYTRATDFFVWYSDDYGDTWNVSDHQFEYLRNIFIYDNKIWALTNNGLHFNELQPTSVDPIVVIDKYLLNQNYPNPFNPTTKISWQAPKDSWQTLTIYDILGNEVATLIDEYKPAGSYEVEFNANGLASGIYFYTLRSENFSDTKKLVLLK